MVAKNGKVVYQKAFGKANILPLLVFHTILPSLPSPLLRLIDQQQVAPEYFYRKKHFFFATIVCCNTSFVKKTQQRRGLQEI